MTGQAAPARSVDPPPDDPAPDIPMRYDVDGALDQLEKFLLNALKWNGGPADWPRGRRSQIAAARSITVTVYRFVCLCHDVPEPVEDAARYLKDCVLTLRAEDLAAGHPRDPDAGRPLDATIARALRALHAYRHVEDRHDPRTPEPVAPAVDGAVDALMADAVRGQPYPEGGDPP